MVKASWKASYGSGEKWDAVLHYEKTCRLGRCVELRNVSLVSSCSTSCQKLVADNDLGANGKYQRLAYMRDAACNVFVGHVHNLRKDIPTASQSFL